jgi:hypothetical protein
VTHHPDPRRLALVALLAAAPLLARPIEPVIHAEGSLGVDTNPLREAGGEQGAYPFLGALLDVGLARGGERTTLRATLSEGARLYALGAQDANVLASRLDLDGSWAADERLDLGGSLAVRDLSELGGVRSETGGQLRLDARLKASRFDVEVGGGVSALFPRTRRLEDFASVGPDAGISFGFSPADRHHLRVGYELRVRTFPSWPTSREDVANGLVIDWSRSGSVIGGLGYALTGNHSNVPGGTYLRHRVWARAAAELPWDVTVAAVGSLQWSNYPGGLIADTERLLAENDERENALELRFSRPVGRNLEAVLKLAAYGSELSAGTGERLPYRREVVQFSIGWRPE